MQYHNIWIRNSEDGNMTLVMSLDLGARRLGQISKGYTASLTMWNDDPFILSSYPEKVMAEGKIVYRE